MAMGNESGECEVRVWNYVYCLVSVSKSASEMGANEYSSYICDAGFAAVAVHIQRKLARHRLQRLGSEEIQLVTL